MHEPIRPRLVMLAVLVLAVMSCAPVPWSALPDDLDAPSSASAPSRIRLAQAPSRQTGTCREVVIRLPGSIVFHGDQGTVAGSVRTNLTAGTYSIRYDARTERFVVTPWHSRDQVIDVSLRGRRTLYQAYIASMTRRTIPLRVEGATTGTATSTRTTASAGTAASAGSAQRGASCRGCTSLGGVGAAEGMRLMEAAGANEPERAWAHALTRLARVPSARDVRTTLAGQRQRLGIPDAPARTTHEAVQRAGAEAWADLRDWEQDLWRDYLGRYGHTADVTSAGDLHITPDTRLNMALRIVPRYVRPGAREAWDALVNDPAFLGSTIAGITTYFALWLTPEPFFTKTTAVLTTIGLVAVAGFTAVEILELARAWMRLRDDVSKARTLDAIERAAERFGKSLGSSSLRLLLALTTAIVGKVLPASPRPVAPGPVTAGAGAGAAVLGAAGHAVKLVKGGVVVLVAPLAMAKLRGRDAPRANSRADSKEPAAKARGSKAMPEGRPQAGAFSITSWAGYPSWAPRPTGPFRLLSGAEYDAARKSANVANAALRRADPARYAGKQIHEIHPIKFGGSPTDPANKIALTPDEHAQLTRFWNQLLRNLQ